MPIGFNLNSTTLKYNGLEEPEAWLDDSLTAVKFQRGTNVTAMQCVQLMLESSTRHWLKNLRRGSISSWSQFRGGLHRKLQIYLQATSITRGAAGMQARSQGDLASIHPAVDHTQELSGRHIR